MVTNNYTSKVILSGIILLIGLTGCPGPCPETVYSFGVTASFSPDKDSIKLGDTLLLRSTINAQLVDLKSNRLIDYSNASDIGMTLSVDELALNGSYLGEAADSFSYVSKQGQIYTALSTPSPQRVKQVRYQQVGSSYELTSALIPRKKGLFAIAVTNGQSNGKPRSDECDKAAFQMTVLSNNRSLSYIGVAFKRPLSRNDSLHFYVLKVY